MAHTVRSVASAMAIVMAKAGGQEAEIPALTKELATKHKVELQAIADWFNSDSRFSSMSEADILALAPVPVADWATGNVKADAANGARDLSAGRA